MDSVSSAVASAASQADVTQSASIMALKKSLDVQAESAASLIQDLRQPQQYNNPANLGQNVDTRV